MKDQDANNLCTHGGDILAYLYNEMPSADRETFELHLADCGTCIDDFAELSQSRYPVFEWKQLEFDPLPTPRVVIPFESPSVSWFDKLRASLAFRPAYAFGTLAAVALFASIAAMILLRGSSDAEVANVAPVAAPGLPSPLVEIEEPEIPSRVLVEEPQKSPSRRDFPKVVKASVTDAKPATRSANRLKTTQQARRQEPLPALNSIDEDEDDSLRLADIFDEVGG
jgi:hypothetical protein